MQITYLSAINMQGASTIRMHSYAAEIAKLGHDVTFITAPCATREAENVEMKYMSEIKQKPFRGLSLTVSGFFSLLSVKKPDIIHFSKPLPVTGLPSILYKKTSSCKIICDWDDLEGRLGFSKFRTFPTKQIISFFESWTPKHVDGITVVSKALEKLAKNCCDKVLYLPHLADVKKFGSWVSGNEIRKRYGWGKKKILLFTGGFGKYSDAPICIKAMEHVARKDVFLAIFGRGEAKRSIEKMIIDLGLEGRVKTYEPIPYEEMPKLLAAADVLLSPFNKDWANNRYRLPVKIFEYMAAAKPIVAQDVGDARLILGNTAYVTKTNEEDFAKGITKALHGGRGIGVKARKRAGKEFTTKQVKRLEKFYESFI